MDLYFRLPDLRRDLVLPRTEFIVGDCRPVLFPIKLAPPRAVIDIARSMTPTASSLWIPSRIARAGEVVTQGLLVVMPEGDDAWTFFCDDMPGAYFSHPCRFFLIDGTGSNVRVVEASAPPIEQALQYIEDRPSRRFLFT